MRPTKFQVHWPFSSGEEAKIDLQHGGSDGSILAIFYLQVTQMFLTRFQVNWPFSSGEEAKNRFSRWPLRRTPWIFDRIDFNCV